MNESDLIEISQYTTEDIQHDLAMLYADKLYYYDDLTIAYENELKKRDAALPINCRWEHNIYARFKSELKYELE